MKKGFTLIEVLAVIIILGFLSVIVIPPILKAIDGSREKSYEQLISNIKQSTQLYIRQNKEDIEGIHDIGNVISIKLKDLVDDNVLKAPIIDPRNEEEISLETSISILVERNNKYTITIGSILYVE